MVRRLIRQRLVILHFYPYEPATASRCLVLDVHVESRAVVRVLHTGALRRILERDLIHRADAIGPEAPEHSLRKLEVCPKIGKQIERKRLARQEVRPQPILINFLPRTGAHCGHFATCRSPGRRGHQIRAAFNCECFWKPGAKWHPGVPLAERKPLCLPPEGLEQARASLKPIVCCDESVTRAQEVIGDVFHALETIGIPSAGGSERREIRHSRYRPRSLQWSSIWRARGTRRA